MIEENRYAAVGVESEEPIFLLFVGHDIAESLCQQGFGARVRKGRWITSMSGSILCRKPREAPQA